MINKPFEFLSGSGVSKIRLSFMQKFKNQEDYERINTFCRRLERENKFYFEAARLIMHEKHRDRRVFSFFMSGIFALGRFIDVKYFFLSCSYQHASYYEKKWGMSKLPGEVEYGMENDKKPQPVLGVYLNAIDFSRTTVDRMCLQMQSEGKIMLADTSHMAPLCSC